MMKILLGILFALGLSLDANAKEPSVTAPLSSEPSQCVPKTVETPAPTPMSCTAAGHDCGSPKECCSGMCDKKKGKCA